MPVCVVQLEALPGHSPGTELSPCPRERAPELSPRPLLNHGLPHHHSLRGWVGRPQRSHGRTLTWDLPADTCPALRRGGMNNLNRLSFSMAPTKGRASPSAGTSRRPLRAGAKGGKLRRPLSSGSAGRERRLAELRESRAPSPREPRPPQARPGRTERRPRGDRDDAASSSPADTKEVSGLPQEAGGLGMSPWSPAGVGCTGGPSPPQGKRERSGGSGGVRRGRGVGVPPVQGINGRAPFSCDHPVLQIAPPETSWMECCVSGTGTLRALEGAKAKSKPGEIKGGQTFGVRNMVSLWVQGNAGAGLGGIS